MSSVDTEFDLSVSHIPPSHTDLELSSVYPELELSFDNTDLELSSVYPELELSFANTDLELTSVDPDLEVSHTLTLNSVFLTLTLNGPVDGIKTAGGIFRCPEEVTAECAVGVGVDNTC